MNFDCQGDSVPYIVLLLRAFEEFQSVEIAGPRTTTYGISPSLLAAELFDHDEVPTIPLDPTAGRVQLLYILVPLPRYGRNMTGIALGFRRGRKRPWFAI